MRINIYSEDFDDYIDRLVEIELSDINIKDLFDKSWMDDCIDWEKVEKNLKKEICQRVIDEIEERKLEDYLAYIEYLQEYPDYV